MLLFEAFECTECGDIQDTLRNYGDNHFCEECRSVDSFKTIMLDENGDTVDVVELTDDDITEKVEADHTNVEKVADVLDFMQRRHG